MKLVDTADEQALLEDLIEEGKPPVPPECRHLHFLMSTPFRYGAPYPRGSRFRRAGMTEGVFYASELPETAVAETAFLRLLFYAESPATPWPENPGQYTAFTARLDAEKVIDLSEGKYRSRRARWLDPIDHSHCQAFADIAREAGIEVIRYESVRDPAHGMNLALLTCRVFADHKPTSLQTWHIRVSESGAQAICEPTKARITYGRKTFASDPRIAKMQWARD